MEKIMFVVRSLKERLVINLGSLLLHGDEDPIEQIEERAKRGKTKSNKIWHEKENQFW
jgi:hypothetical protein